MSDRRALTPSIGLPIIIEPRAAGTETSQQGHGRSRTAVRGTSSQRAGHSRSPLRSFSRSSNESSAVAFMISQTVSTVQDPAGVGSAAEAYKVEALQPRLLAAKDMVKHAMGHAEIYLRPDASLETEFHNPTRRRVDRFLLSAVDNDEGKNLISSNIIAEMKAKDYIKPLEPGEQIVHIQGNQLRLKGKIYLEWRTAQQDRNDPSRGDHEARTLGEKRESESSWEERGEAVSDEERQRAEKLRRTLFYVTDVPNIPFDATLSRRAVEDYKLVR